MLRFLGVALAVTASLVGSAAVHAQAPQFAVFKFQPNPGETLSYLVKTREQRWYKEREDAAREWSYRIDLKLARPVPGGFEATLTVGEVTAGTGGEPGSFETLARAAAGGSFDVVIGRGGQVERVPDWPRVKARLAERAAGLTDRTSAAVLRATLDRLDDREGAGALDRPLLLMSGAYTLPFSLDGSMRKEPEWLGPNAYPIPGRTVHTNPLGRDDAKRRVLAEFKVETDQASIRRHLGPVVQGLLTSAPRGPAVGRASSELDRAMDGGRVSLDERGGLSFDIDRRMVRGFAHWVTVTVGDVRTEDRTVLELLPKE